jgi:hypothetical protein
MNHLSPPDFKPREKMLIRIGVLGWIAAVCIQVFACQNDPQPTALLQLTVLKEGQEVPAKNAKVALYSSLQDWQAETNPVTAVAVTNSQGSFIFSNLPYQKVYMDIKSEDLTQDNWESRIEVPLITARFGYNNRSYSILKPSFIGRFSRAKGKHWSLATVFHQGEDISATYPECLKDNTFMAFKDKQVKFFEQKIKCESSKEDSLQGLWHLAANRLVFTFGLEKMNFDLIYFSKDSLVLGTLWGSKPIELYYTSL